MPKSLCVIPARGGSTRIPRKNIKLFKGKPMVSYSIRAALESGVFDEVMVSTDDEEIAEIAKAYGARVPFLRSAATSDSVTGLADVLIEVYGEYRKRNATFEYIACVLATAPLINATYLKEAYKELVSDSACNGICSTEVFSYPPQRGLVLRDGYLQMAEPKYYFARSQDLEPIYHDCGQFFIFRIEPFLMEKKLYVPHMKPFLLDGVESQDIDNVTDLELAEIKFDFLREREAHS